MNGGLYLYCVCRSTGKNPFEGKLQLKGLGGQEVSLIQDRDLVAIVQECAGPFSSQDPKQISEWVLTHQSVVDEAWKKYGNVIPFSFDTIIVPKEGCPAMENLIQWIRSEGTSLKEKLDRLEGKAEYGIQVSWDPKIVAPKVIRHDVEIQGLEDKIRSGGEGTAYLLDQKRQEVLRRRLEIAADAYFKEFYEKIRGVVEEVRVDKARKEEPPMLMNLSCLLPKIDSPRLGEELNRIGRIEGFFVRFTGPWPPYSFVNR